MLCLEFDVFCAQQLIWSGKPTVHDRLTTFAMRSRISKPYSETIDGGSPPPRHSQIFLWCQSDNQARNIPWKYSVLGLTGNSDQTAAFPGESETTGSAAFVPIIVPGQLRDPPASGCAEPSGWIPYHHLFDHKPDVQRRSGHRPLGHPYLHQSTHHDARRRR